MFIDLNDDGNLDFFNSMHAHSSDVTGYKGRMELGENTNIVLSNLNLCFYILV